MADIRTFIEHQVLAEGQSTRMACPSCGGNNTLSITKEAGQVKYMCYRASCTVRGIHNKGLTTEDLKSIIKSNIQTVKAFVMPDFIKSLNRSKDAVSYIKFYGLYEAYENELCDIRYDIKNNRVVFVIYDEKGNVCDRHGTPSSVARVDPVALLLRMHHQQLGLHCQVNTLVSL